MMEKKYAEDYTLPELMGVCTAKEIKDGDRVFIGVGLPTIAAALAIQTHAPHATMSLEAGHIGGHPLGAPLGVGDTIAAHNCTYATSMWWVFSDIQRGYFDISVLGAGQVDKYGNINNTARFSGETDYRHPALRMPGSGGSNDTGSHAGRTVIMVTLERRKFPEKLDYLTVPGWLDGTQGARERAGLYRGGPVVCVTDKCVFRFDEKTHEMYLDTLHPGVSIEDARKEVEWDLKVAPEVKVTEPPTVEEIEIMRALDPLGIILGKGKSLAVTFTEWADTIEAGWEKVKSMTGEV